MWGVWRPLRTGDDALSLYADLEQLAQTAKHAPEQLDPEQVRYMCRRAQRAAELLDLIRTSHRIEIVRSDQEATVRFTVYDIGLLWDLLADTDDR